MHKGQRKALRRWKRKRYLVQPCGRGFGKTMQAEYILGKGALNGEEWHYGAPDQDRVDKMYFALETRLEPLIVARHGGKYLRLVTGGEVRFWTLNKITAGQGYHPTGGWVIDECGLVPYLWNIWTISIRPSLTRHKARALFLGTPKGQNDYHKVKVYANDHPEEWAVYIAASVESPYQDPAEIEAAKQDTPEDQFRQEYLAEFLEDGAGVFKYISRAIKKGVDGKPLPMPALADLPTDRVYQFSVDLASTQDFSVVTVWDVEAQEAVYIDRRQGDYLPQIENLNTMCELLKPTAVTIEKNGNKAVMELIKKRKSIPLVEWLTTNDSKQEIIDGLTLAFEHNQITIPDFQPLRNELMAFQSYRLPGGGRRFEAPTGLHDDCVMSLAIGWRAIAKPRQKLKVREYDQLGQ
jgi:hypothetical protein